jgi:hypothetical protein
MAVPLDHISPGQDNSFAGNIQIQNEANHAWQRKGTRNGMHHVAMVLNNFRFSQKD